MLNFDYILISLRLLLYHNPDLDSGPSFRWQYTLSITDVVWVTDFADSEILGTKNNSIPYKTHLNSILWAFLCYSRTSIYPHIRPNMRQSQKPNIYLTFPFIYVILIVCYVGDLKKIQKTEQPTDTIDRQKLQILHLPWYLFCTARNTKKRI